ncbi:MAG: alkaline phosphatase family protein, partial [Candidatus Heimdallarchaeota archaeon]
MHYNQKRRVLVIGLDGGTFDLIDPLLDQGKLPNLQKLMSQGYSSTLMSTIHPISPTAWASFTTGVNPGKHGLFDFSKRQHGSYEQIPTTSRDIHTPAIWHLLAQKALKVGLINIPGTYPPEPVNGFMISGFPTPEENEDFTYPSSLLQELHDHIPGFHLQPQIAIRDGNEEAFLSDINEVTDNVTKATLYLAGSRSWDLLITVYVGADALGHHFWKFKDPHHPFFCKKLHSKYGNAIDSIYQRIDKEIGKILATIDENTHVIIMSDHGFGGAYYAVALNNWLLRQGWMKIRRGIVSKLKYLGFRSGITLTNAYRLAKIFRATKYRQKAYKEKSRLRNLIFKTFFSINDIDWSRTKAYCVGNGGQIFINVEGREPQGIVVPEDRLEVAKAIKSDLLKLTDKKTGGVIFNQVFLREEIYNGPYVEKAADLVFFDSKFRFQVIRFLEFGSNQLTFPHPVWAGTHRLNGILIVNGPGIQPVRRKKEEVRIWDITPTILALLGVPIADYMDGKPIKNAFY